MMEKKMRPRLTKSQTQFLCLLFQYNQRPTQMLKRQISKDFEIPLKTVQIWFQNRRAKEKKQSEEAQMSIGEGDPFSSILPLPSSIVGKHLDSFSLVNRGRKKQL
ncbi:hypothetical protein NEFER03_0307 [Nematocida sp. LUAm3]|nr:hypothetical protein NEFER03_0307 [Nematocida sp. LUAm3]KAI5173759.1 hypothetical protein NEFER02_0275 [Nematocida sp. LUAm2]KAI5176982.1 hypothetical protein NEFER01_0307 [Nematocida sp. LUAm1]